MQNKNQSSEQLLPTKRERAGRPRVLEPGNQVIAVRLEPEDMAFIRDQMARHGLTLPQFMRMVLAEIRLKDAS